MKIINCFLFYNELDLLELRLRELYDHVDQFVVIESDHSLTNRPKPYLLEQYQHRYTAWLDKIIHIKHVSKCNSDPWQNESNQRNALMSVIKDFNDQDVVILQDADEIARPVAIEHIRNTYAMLYGLRMPLFNFKFNYMQTGLESYNLWTSAARIKWIKQFSAQILRDQIHNLLRLPFTFGANGQRHTIHPHEVDIIDHGGWHFSYLGDEDWIINKIQNTAHQEDNTPEIIEQLNIEASILAKKSWNYNLPHRFEIIDLNNYFPESCKLFPQYCLPDSGLRAQDLLSEHVA